MRHPVVKRRLARGRKARARAFYRKRRGCGHDVLPADEAEAMRPWRGCCDAALFILAAAVVGWAAVAILFS